MISDNNFMDALDWDERIVRVVRGSRTVVQHGRVTQAFGTTVRVSGIHARIGQQCKIVDRDTGKTIVAEVVGLSEGQAILLPLTSLHGIAGDAHVEVLQQQSTIPFGSALLGRVIDSFANPLDDHPMPGGLQQQPLYAEAPNPLIRQPICTPLSTGVRSIDTLLTVGVGQRMGVFAAAGGGKSTLLGMLARQANADVIIVALIGERGREVREFIEHSLGEQGHRRSVVVVATSDRPAMERVRAAHAATAIAEGFRAQGKRVLLLMDSVTRFARALREIGLSVGEPAVRRGFPPSVFAEMPRLFERSGNDALGSITAFYTVLVEDEDSSDPVAEEVRSILDGHIILSRKLGQDGHYPAIDVLQSASRVFSQISSIAHRSAAEHVRALLSKHAEIEFLLQVGEYKNGSDTLADEAIAKLKNINELLRQKADETATLKFSIERLEEIAGE